MVLLFVLFAWYADKGGEAGMGFAILSMPWSLPFMPLLMNWPHLITDACIHHYDDHWYCIWEMRLMNTLQHGLMWLCVLINSFILYCLFGLRLKR
ncbi:MAG: hypothetical protein AB7L92_06360 [Alphaproteobacteria bacterium]